MKTIEVKTNAVIFKDVWNARKYSELRLDDRDYRIGDVLKQAEWKPNKKVYTGRTVSMRICGITWLHHWIEGDFDRRWCILHLDAGSYEREWHTQPPATGGGG